MRGRCGTYPTRQRARRSRGELPNTVTVPACGVSRPSRIRSNVDFPDPFGPASAANSPARTSRPTRSSTSSGPYAKDTSRADSTTAASVELSMILIMPARSVAGIRRSENAGMAHDHGGHDHGDALRRTAARNVGRLWVALALTVVFVVVEAITAVVAGSLALLSDAAHMLTDGVAIALALGSIVVANRASKDGSRTFGLFRLEILASLLNAILTFAVAGYVLFEAVVRLTDGDSSVEAAPMLVVALAGLAVNLIVFFMLRTGAQDSLAVRGAYVDAMADAAGSVGVIVAAVVIATTGWDPIDPIVAMVIGVWILPRAWRLAASALRVLLQVAPEHVDLDAIRTQLMALPGVVDVHDLHVWTLTSEMDVASAHVMVGVDADAHGVLDQARELLLEHEIAHATIQVEPDDHAGCAELNW